ncbi:MAG TPA: HAD family phosphatase [Candidatus Saccharimonadales bacterium]|nr:HAD family phosphatase [Candidatus Saccharimonadales bacterium]
MIKAVGFDYGGVIAGLKRPGEGFNARASRILDMPVEDYKQIYFSKNEAILTGQIESWGDFWRQFVTEIGKPESYSAIMALSDETNRQLDIIDPSMIGLVDELRGSGYMTGLLSNNTVQNGARMRELGVDKHFDVFQVSAETGFMKPDPRAFGHFIQALGVQPPELAFVDDTLNSLSTASSVGFAAIHFTSHEQARQELVDYGVVF